MNRRAFLSTVAAASTASAVSLPALAETSGPLIPLLLDYERKKSAFNTCGLADLEENERCENAFSKASDALADEIFERGAIAATLSEAQTATRMAVAEYRGGDERLSAKLALAALGYFLGEEAVS